MPNASKGQNSKRHVPTEKMGVLLVIKSILPNYRVHISFMSREGKIGGGCLCKTPAPSRIPLMVRSYYPKGHGNTAGLNMMESKRDLKVHSVTRTVFEGYSLSPCSLVKSALSFDKTSFTPHPGHHNLMVFLLLIVHSRAISFSVIFLLTHTLKL